MSEIHREYFLYNQEIKAVVEFQDQWLEAGECLYDVLKIKNSVPLFLEKYLRRVQQSARLSNLKIWLSDTEIVDNIYKLIEINNIDEDILKIVFLFDNQRPKMFLAYLMQNNAPTLEQYIYGVTTASMTAVRQNPNAKIFNFAMRHEAAKKIQAQNVYEIILLDNQNNITEGSRSNVFFIKDEEVFTTVDEKVLPGITRENTIELCVKNNITLHQTIISIEQASRFDAMFITGTSRKILPVRKFDEIMYDVENKILRKLQLLYNILIEDYTINGNLPKFKTLAKF